MAGRNLSESPRSTSGEAGESQQRSEGKLGKFAEHAGQFDAAALLNISTRSVTAAAKVQQGRAAVDRRRIAPLRDLTLQGFTRRVPCGPNSLEEAVGRPLVPAGVRAPAASSN